MADKHKSEQVVDSIGVGKLYDPPDDFFEKFFETDNGGLTAKQLYFKRKRGIKVEFNYWIPSQRLETPYPNLIGYKYRDPSPPQQKSVEVKDPYGWEFISADWPYRGKEPIYAKTCITIGNPQPTKPGPIFVVDEIKTGTRLKFYKVWINGQERYLTENQLKYVKEA